MISSHFYETRLYIFSQLLFLLLFYKATCFLINKITVHEIPPGTTFSFIFPLAETQASLITQLVKNLPPMQETPVQSLGQEIPWKRDRLPTPVFLGFPCGSTGKESSCSVGDLGLIPGLGRSPGEGKGNYNILLYPVQYSGLEKSMNKVHGVAKSQTRLTVPFTLS